MKKRKGIVAACAVLAIVLVAAVVPTAAWLTAQSEPVVNTFAGGTISIVVDEAVVDSDGKALDSGERTQEGNQYKYIAGTVLDKDPTVTVMKGSEPCYVFLCVENGLNDKFTMDTDTTSWNVVGELSENGVVKTVYKYIAGEGTVDASEAEEDIKLPPVFTKVTISADLTTEDIETLGEKTLSATAYAIQTESVNEDTAIASALVNFGISTGQ